MKFTSLKASDVNWIDDIPKEWTLQRLKYVATCNDEALEDKYEEEFQIEYVDISSVEFPYGIIKTEIFNFSEAPSRARRLVKQGDILVSTVRTYLKAIAQITPERSHIVASTGFAAVRPKYLDTNFAKFIIESNGFINEVIANSKGVSYPAINPGDLMNLCIPVPPLEIQKHIGEFLAAKTSQIDTLIRNKQKLIELLKEERAAIINQAVTKGIDPKVKMKASGIQWLGEIPAHWEVKKLRYISSCQNGISQPAEYFGSGFPFVSYGDVYKNEILPNTPSGLAQSSAKDQELYSIKTGDILFTRTSETVEEIAIASTAMQDIDQVVFSGFLIRVRPAAKMLNELFSSFYFRSSLHRDFFMSGMNIVTRASLSQELLKNLPVLLPPLHEQEAIGKYLLERSAAVTTSIETLTRQIDLLQEYRTALISEVVTGKFRVIN